MDRLAGAYIAPGATFPMRDVPPGVVVHVQVEKIYGQGPWQEGASED
jgi:ribosomal protein L2